MSYQSVNVVLLRRILKTILDSEGPIPSHILAVQLGIHPSTVRGVLKKAEVLLGVKIDAGQRGYEGVQSWGSLRETDFMSLASSSRA